MVGNRLIIDVAVSAQEPRRRQWDGGNVLMWGESIIRSCRNLDLGASVTGRWSCSAHVALVAHMTTCV